LTASLNGYNIKISNPCYSFGYDKSTNGGESRRLFFNTYVSIMKI
jgi:hypothetical protein